MSSPKTVLLGDLPIEWRRGSGLKKSDISDRGENHCVLYGELFTKHKNVLIDNDRLSKTSKAGKVFSKKGDVLVPGTSTASKHDMVLAREIGLSGVLVGGDINIIRPGDGVFARKYVAYFFDTLDAHEQLEKYITGSTGIIHISNTGLKNLRIPLPNLKEQDQITKKLDEAFAAIDKAKRNTEKNLQNSQELFQTNLKSIFSNPGAAWKGQKLDQIAKNLDSKRIPITMNLRTKGAYPYYGASGIVDYVNDYIFDDDLLLVSEDGANLLARTYPIAFSISGKTWVNNHAHVLQFKDIVTQRFIEIYLNSISLDAYVSGMAQPKLNQKMLNSIIVPVPPVSEQEKIVAEFDTLSDATKRMESIYHQKLANLEELRQSILKQAFEGKL